MRWGRTHRPFDRLEDHPLLLDAFIRVIGRLCHQPRFGVPLRCAPVTAKFGAFLWSSSGMVRKQPDGDDTMATIATLTQKADGNLEGTPPSTSPLRSRFSQTRASRRTARPTTLSFRQERVRARCRLEQNLEDQQPRHASE